MVLGLLGKVTPFLSQGTQTSEEDVHLNPGVSNLWAMAHYWAVSCLKPSRPKQSLWSSVHMRICLSLMQNHPVSPSLLVHKAGKVGELCLNP